LKHVKKFLKQPGGIDQYEGVEIKWQPGHRPDLVLIDPETGKQKEVIDLSLVNKKGYESVHELFQQYFARMKPLEAAKEVPAPKKRRDVLEQDPSEKKEPKPVPVQNVDLGKHVKMRVKSPKASNNLQDQSDYVGFCLGLGTVLTAGALLYRKRDYIMAQVFKAWRRK